MQPGLNQSKLLNNTHRGSGLGKGADAGGAPCSRRDCVSPADMDICAFHKACSPRGPMRAFLYNTLFPLFNNTHTHTRAVATEAFLLGDMKDEHSEGGCQ